MTSGASPTSGPSLPLGLDYSFGVRQCISPDHSGSVSIWNQVAYLVEGVLDDHLAIRVRNAREQIPYRRVSLFVNVLLLLWNGLGKASICASALELVAPKSCACLLHDGLANVMADSVQLGAESL